MLKRLMILAAVMSLLAIAGCGGKKAVEPTPATDTGSSAPAVEESNTPVENVANLNTDVSPISLNDVFFDFDQFNLSSEAKSTLEANAREMKRVSDAGVTIEGHCDERGTKAYNLALGDKRANAAKDYLVALGVTASRISTISYGKERPFETGSSESAWAKNRRAHFAGK